MLISIQSSHAAWIRLYTSGVARFADSSRLQGVDPAPDAGVIAEIITTTAQTIPISPACIGYSSESPTTTTVPISVTNLSGSSAAITVTLTVLGLEP